MNSIVQLEASVAARPNSIEANQALAEAYAREGRWEEATEAYETVVDLYPATATLYVNRIRLGAIALGISSLLFFVSAILRTSPHGSDTLLSVAVLNSADLAISNMLFMPILILLSCAAISIYKLLSTTSDGRLAFWAMVSILVGVGLFLPFFSIKAVVMSAAAELYLKGNLSAFDVYFASLFQPLAFVFTLGGYLLLVGLTFFNVAIWNTAYLPKWASTLLWIGWSLFIVTQELPFALFMEKLSLIHDSINKRILIALLTTIGGIGLALGLWKQAAAQLAPTNDSLEKADS